MSRSEFRLSCAGLLLRERPAPRRGITARCRKREARGKSAFVRRLQHRSFGPVTTRRAGNQPHKRQLKRAERARPRAQHPGQRQVSAESGGAPPFQAAAPGQGRAPQAAPRTLAVRLPLHPGVVPVSLPWAAIRMGATPGTHRDHTLAASAYRGVIRTAAYESPACRDCYCLISGQSAAVARNSSYMAAWRCSSNTGFARSRAESCHRA